MLADLIIEKKAELNALPKGSLILKKGCYYHKYRQKETGITRNRELISALARRRYLQKEISILEENRDLADWYDAHYVPIIPSELIASFPSSYQGLPIYSFLGTSGKNTASANPYKREQLKYLSNGGILMRSKSEVLIANELEACGISYQYEPRLVIGGKIIYPDFLLEHPWDQRMLIWEHLGLLDRPDYQESNREKLAHYCKNGIYPFQSLICTFEEDIKDREQIRQIIRLLHLA